MAEVEDWVPPDEAPVKASSKAKAPEVEDWVPPTEEEQQAAEVLGPEDNPLLTAMMQGGSLGASDEMLAKIESLIAGTSYRDNWNRRQKELDRLRKLAPNEMMAGEVTTPMLMSIALAAMGGRMGRLGRAATVGTGFGLAAGQGALEGMGKGWRPYTGINPETGEPLTTAQGLGTAGLNIIQGAGEGVIGHGLVKGATALGGLIAEPVWNWTKPARDAVLKGTSKLLFNVPREAAEAMIESPEAWRGKMKSVKDIAEKELLPLINKISAKVSRQDKKAAGLLTQNPVGTVDEALDTVKDRLKQTGVLFDDPDNPGELLSHFPGVMDDLDLQKKYLRSLEGKKGYLDEKDLYKYRETLEGKAKYSSTNPGKVANGYKLARGAINEVLDQNVPFKEAMTSVRAMTPDLEDMRKALKFRTVNMKDARYATKDATYGVLRQLPKKEQTLETMEKFLAKYAPDSDAIGQIKRARYDKHFGLRPAGFSSTAGGGVGAFLATQGFPEAATAAAAAGVTRDVFGPTLLKGMAVGPKKGGIPAFLDTMLRPAAVSASVTPTAKPEFIGYPLYNISAEEHLRRLKAAQDARDAEAQAE